MRDCGDCTACCTITSVKSIEKECWETCPHLSNRCSIYENRPAACANFRCAWLSDETGITTDDDRPDKSGVMLFPAHPGSLLEVATSIRPLGAYEVRQHAFSEQLAQDLIKRLTAGNVIGFVQFGEDPVPFSFAGPEHLIKKLVSFREGE